MSNQQKKYMIALPITLLLCMSIYFSYDYLLATLRDFTGYIQLFILAIVSMLSSVYALYTLFSSSTYSMKNLASHVNQKLASAKRISEHVLSNDKLAYDYIKSNFDRVLQKENNISAEYQANKSFLHNISYEIRTPMNAISGYSRLLKETVLTKEQEELITLIENSYTQLDTILTQMGAEKISNKAKTKMENSSFNIIREIESSVETFAVEADKKDIVLGLYIDPNIPHNLLGDGVKLSQVITHLIDNAMEVSSEYSTVNIQLEKIKTKSSNVSIKFSICDEREILTDEELFTMNKIFDDLEIIDDGEINNIKNLTISNRIIHDMGASLTVTNKDDKETCFSFMIQYEKDIEEVDRKSSHLFKGMKIGLALPQKDIKRQIDYNLQTYVEYLGGSFSIYGYDEITDNTKSLPDIMFVYHSYAKNRGELDIFSNLSCKTVLITSGTLRAQVDTQKHLFSSVMYAPITMSKILRVLSESKEKNKEPIEQHKNIHALVAEDNSISLAILSNMLQNMNIMVTPAVNGKEAFQLYQNKEFDIIFMDINMPIMGGYTATAKIIEHEKKKQLKHVPIIAFSAEKIEKRKYVKAGMDGLLIKPIHIKKIEEIIKYHFFEYERAS